MTKVITFIHDNAIQYKSHYDGRNNIIKHKKPLCWLYRKLGFLQPEPPILELVKTFKVASSAEIEKFWND